MAARPPFLVPQSYNAPLNQMDELSFRNWVQQNNIPFDPQAQHSDYDMRGFWQAAQQGNPQASTAVNPNDNQIHYPDYWKTPEHLSFSNESQWAAGPNAPQWVNDSQLAAPNGRILYDEKSPQGLLGILNQRR